MSTWDQQDEIPGPTVVEAQKEMYDELITYERSKYDMRFGYNPWRGLYDRYTEGVTEDLKEERRRLIIESIDEGMKNCGVLEPPVLMHGKISTLGAWDFNLKEKCLSLSQKIFEEKIEKIKLLKGQKKLSLAKILKSNPGDSAPILSADILEKIGKNIDKSGGRTRKKRKSKFRRKSYNRKISKRQRKTKYRKSKK